MSTLYEIVDRYKELFDMFDDSDIEDEDTIQGYFDTLDGIEGEFSEKAENIAMFIKNLENEVKGLEKAAKVFNKRKKAKENKVNRLKEYLKSNMDIIGLKKLETLNAVISIRNNAESILVEDEKKLVEWAKTNDTELLKFKEPELKKTEIKRSLQNGEEIPYVSLHRTQSVIIK